MNFAEQLVVLPSLLLDASRNISSPIYKTVSSFVDNYYKEQQVACEEVISAFDEIVC